MSKKAYKVDAGDTMGEGYACVVLADSRTDAKKQAYGRDIFHDQEFIYLRAIRAPEFDKYDHEPTPRELVEGHGWWQECQGCNCHIDEHTEKPLWVSPDVGYCSRKCKRDSDARHRKFVAECKARQSKDPQ